MESLNGALQGLVHGVQTYPGLALACWFVTSLVTLAVALVGFARVGKLSRRLSLMLRGVDGDSLEQLLLDYAQRSSQTHDGLARATEAGNANTAALRQVLRRTGLVRYDAFTNMGGLQSFSLALLDDQDNGIVLTGLNSRQEMRVYAKPLRKGVSPIPLTPEEQRAVATATLPSEMPTDTIIATEY